MNDYTIDWSKIRKGYDFENLVKTWVFLKYLLSVKSIKECNHTDLFWTAWNQPNNTYFQHDAIFTLPDSSEEKQIERLKRKFDEDYSRFLKDRPNTTFQIYTNAEHIPPEWEGNKQINVVKREEIAKEINSQWKPIFKKYFTGALTVEDPNEYSILEEFSKSLVVDIESHSIKELKNIISWVEEIAIYRPKEIYEFCEELFSIEKESIKVKDGIFGEVTQSRKDFLENTPNLLTSVAAHEDHFENALELLIKISLELQPSSKIMGMHGLNYLDDLTGYYYNRDFILEKTQYSYSPTFNQKTIDVLTKLINQADEELAIRCLGLLQNLIKLKIDYTRWNDEDHSIAMHNIRLPLGDENLSGIRKQALDLILSTFNKIDRTNIQFHCLEELHGILRYITSYKDFKYEIDSIFEFLKSNKNITDLVLQNKLIELIDDFKRVDDDNIKESALSIRQELEQGFDFKLYNFIFGRISWDAKKEYIDKLVDETIERFDSKPSEFISYLNSLFDQQESSANGIRIYLKLLSAQQNEFASLVIGLIINDNAIIDKLNRELLYEIGHLLTSIRQDNKTKWRQLIKDLLDKKKFEYYIIALTGFHIGDYKEFDEDDIDIIESIIDKADEELKNYICYTTLFFNKYENFSHILRLFYKMSISASDELAYEIIDKLTSKYHSYGKTDKFVEEESADYLVKIIFEFINMNKFGGGPSPTYNFEIMLRILWKISPVKFYEFLKIRIENTTENDSSYQPFPYIIDTLFSEIDGLKQVEILQTIFTWKLSEELDHLVYNLIGEVCRHGISDEAFKYFEEIIDSKDKKKLWKIAGAIRDTILDDRFYDIACKIIINSDSDKEIMSQLYSSFYSKTGGSRRHGEPFPSHIRHKELIKIFKEKYSNKIVQKFLDDFEKEVNGLIKRYQERDAEY